MTLLVALLLGILQGATEFLPISSSGHLAFAQQLLGLSEGMLVFDVTVHVGTLLAIGWVLRARLLSLATAGLALLARRAGDAALRADQRLIGLVVVASIPTACIGFALKGAVETWMTQMIYLAPAFLTTAALLVLSERLGARRRGAGDLTVVDALFVGLVQGFAVIPGISRAGATVASALVRDVDATTAVEFSLLISLPAVAGAGLLAGIEVLESGVPVEPASLAVGFAAALATGIAAVRVLQWAVGRRHLLPFAIYCALLGATALALGARTGAATLG